MADLQEIIKTHTKSYPSYLDTYPRNGKTTVVEIPGRCPLHFGQYLASRIAVYRKMTQDGIGDEKSAISISC